MAAALLPIPLVSMLIPNDWQSAAIIVVAFLSMLGIVDTIRIWYPLRHVPGPALTGVSNWWLIRAHTTGRTHLDLAEVCRKYGTLARIGPKDLVTSDPELIRRMLGVRSAYSRAPLYQAFRFDPSRDNLLSQTDNVKHGNLRAKMAAGYSGKENDHLENSIDEKVLALVNLIDRKYISSRTNYKPMDFARKAEYFTVDVLSTLAFGEAFGDLDRDEDVHRYIEMLSEAGPNIILLSVLPIVRRLLQLPLMRNLLPSSKDKIGFGKVMGIAKKLVGERFGAKKEVRRDMLGSFIAHGLTRDEAESETLLQILAGSDTTSTAIRVIILYITTSPRILFRLLDEIVTFSPESPISDSEARRMPYLQAIIKEGLRIWPPIQNISSKEVPKGGDIINGMFIPGGTCIGYSFTSFCRSKENWGDDANLFRPERWFFDDQARLKDMDSVWDLIFAYGRWQCLGKNVALMELNKVIVELVRKFEFQIADPTRVWKSVNLGIFVQSEMWMRVTRREEKL